MKYEFFLRFNKLAVGLIEITEFIGFDASTFTIEREPMRYGADITYANDEQPAVFWRGLFQETVTPQTFPNGTVVYKLTMGFDYLIQEFRTRGFEMDVDVIIKRGGAELIVGELDGLSAKITSNNSFSCKLVTQGLRAKMRRDAETKIDLLSDKDVNGNPITPMPLQNVLINALPVNGLSEWKQPEAKLEFAGYHKYMNHARNNTQYGVKNSLVPFDAVDDFTWDFDDAVNNFRYVRAQLDLSNIKMRVNVNYTFFYRYLIGSGFDPAASIKGTVIVSPEPFLLSPFPNQIYENVFYEKEIATGLSTDFTENTVVEFTIPFCPKDYCIAVFWTLDYSTGHLGASPSTGASFGDFLGILTGIAEIIGGNIILGGVYLTEVIGSMFSGGPLSDRTAWLINDTSFTIQADQTAFDSIAKGGWWYDVQKQVVKSIAGDSVPLDAPLFQTGGKHHDNIVIDGNRMRGFSDEPFLTTWNDQQKSLQEPNLDFLIGKEKVYNGNMQFHYNNTDMGGFIVPAPTDYETAPDEEYGLKLFTRKYRSWETDKDENNSRDVVHGQEQKRFPNDKTLNERSVEFPHLRDSIMGESTRRKNIIVKPSTALSADNSSFIYKVVPLAPGSFREYGGQFMVKINGEGTLSILNRSENGEATFGWDSLGFGVGDVFQITGGNNVGSYTVEALDTSILTIRPTTIINPVLEGNLYIRFKYFLTNILWQNATNEGYTIIEGITVPDKFGNLDYTLGRMGKEWEPWMAAVAMYHQDKSIRTTEYLNNGTAKTQKIGELAPIIENADLPVSELSDRLFDPVLHTTRFPITFERANQLLEDMETKRGFVRIQTPWDEVIPVFIKKFSCQWAFETGELTGLQKAYFVGIRIQTTTGGVIINDTFYNTSDLAAEWFAIANGYLRIYDYGSVLIVTPILFSEVEIDGQKYTNENEFRNVMLGLI